MIWLYLFLSLLEALLAYISYMALSYRVECGEDMFASYICGGGCTRCNKNDLDGYRGVSLKDEKNGLFYKIGFDPFLAQHRFVLGRFWVFVRVVGFIAFLLPFIPDPDQKTLGVSVFFLIGGSCLTLLSFYSVSWVEKRCDEEAQVFLKLMDCKTLRIPSGILSKSSTEKIRDIILHDCYENAEKWMTKKEKEIIENKGMGDLSQHEQYCALKNIIEYGFSLSEYDFCPPLGQRDVETIDKYD